MKILSPMVMISCLFSQLTMSEESNNNSVVPVSQNYLSAFGESDYRKGSSLKRDVVRLTIIRSHDNPVMIKWYPHDDNEGNSIIEVKKLRRSGESLTPDEIKYVLFYSRSFLVDKKTSSSLSSIVNKAQPNLLPKNDWKGAELDGSVWIYEFVAESSAYHVIRQSPLSYEGIKNLEIDRIEGEMNLNALGMLLWGISQNQEESIY